jgi:hypothetical protein
MNSTFHSHRESGFKNSTILSIALAKSKIEDIEYFRKSKIEEIEAQRNQSLKKSKIEEVED